MCFGANIQLSTRTPPRTPPLSQKIPLPRPTCTNLAAAALQLFMLLGNAAADSVVFGKPATFDYVGKSAFHRHFQLFTI